MEWNFYSRNCTFEFQKFHYVIFVSLSMLRFSMCSLWPLFKSMNTYIRLASKYLAANFIMNHFGVCFCSFFLDNRYIFLVLWMSIIVNWIHLKLSTLSIFWFGYSALNNSVLFQSEVYLYSGLKTLHLEGLFCFVRVGN